MRTGALTTDLRHRLAGCVRPMAMLLALCWSGAALAQPVVVRTIPFDEAATQREMLHFARCAARPRPQLAATILAYDPSNPAFHKMLVQMSQDHFGCLPHGTMLRFNDLFLAAGISEYLLARGAPGGVPVNLRAVSAQTGFTPRSALENLSLCALRATPEMTAALLSTEPASAEEQRTMEALSPALSGCVAAHHSATLTKPMLRAGLAIVSYQAWAASLPAGAAK